MSPAWLGLSALITTALVLAAHRLRTRRLHARQAELEAVVHERTQDLEQAVVWATAAVREAETMRAVTEALSHTVDLQQLLQLILTELRKVVDYDSASVQELDGRVLRIIAGVGFDNLDEILGLTFEVGEPSAPNGQAMRKRAPHILTDTREYPQFRSGYNERAPILSWLGVPLISGDRLIGMIALDKRQPGFYDEEHARLAMSFAAQAAISIENARLFSAARRDAAELERRATALEQTANALRESEERSRAILETAHDAFIAMDQSGAITGWNAQAEAIFGWSRSEAVGQRLSDTIIPPEFREAHARGLARFLATGEGPMLRQRLELTALRKNGQAFPVELTISAVQSGSDPSFGAFIRDITERRKAERRLRAQHAATRVLAEATTLAKGAPKILEAICQSLGWVFGALWEVDLQADRLRCVETWHDPACELAEFERLTRASAFARASGLPGRIWADGSAAWIPDVAKDANFPRAPAARQHGLHGAFGFPVRSHGVVIGVLEFFSPEIQEPDQDLLAMMASVGGQVGQYIERKRAEQAVEEERRQLREIVSHAPVAMAILDREARYVAHSDLWLEDWQLGGQAILGRRHGEVLPQLDASHREALGRALAGDVVSSPEEALELADGTTAFRRWIMHPWRGSEGDVAGVVIVVHDVDVLVKARQAAEDASRAKSAFVASMSHELRTPLNAILGFVQLMERKAGRDAEDREHLAVISRAGAHLLGLINEVLSIAKIESGQMILSSADFDLASLLKSLEQMFRGRAAAKGLKYSVDVRAALPALLRGDDGKLRQILINLVGNAFKFTERGEVRVRTSWSGGRATFEIEDTGPGLTAEEATRLFAAFSQAEAGRKQLDGTGLGLALSRSYARLMEGDITLASEPGKGSVFRVEIALPESPAGAEGTHGRGRRVKSLDANARRTSILVVDDNADGRTLLSKLLGAVGFDVLSAIDGRDGVEAWRKSRPDLVFMDKNMPILDGLAATRAIRAEESQRGLPRTPIVALTASAFEHERAAIHEAGCDTFLAKPFRQEDVFDLLAQTLGVGYVYEDAEPEALTLAAPLTRERLEALPADWRKRFRAALHLADTEAALRLAAEIEHGDAALAGEIVARVKAYRMDELEELLEARAPAP